MAETRPTPQRPDQKQSQPKNIVKPEHARPLKHEQALQRTDQKQKVPEPQKQEQKVKPQEQTRTDTVQAQQKVDQKQKNTESQKKDRSFLKKLKEKQLQQRLADLQEMSIAIDTFEDIFSDFDPRDYTKRDLSDDLLNELKHRYKEAKSGQFEVIFHAPKMIHDETKEKIIVQRIKNHFRHIANQNKKDIDSLRRRGLLYIGVGVVILALFTFANYHDWLSDLNLEILGVLFVPLGWFGVWEGFSKVVDIPWKLTDEQNFNLKMTKANYQFKFLQ